jgi:hypothetical protein
MAGPVAAQFGLAPDEIAWYRARLNDVNNAEKAIAALAPRTTYVGAALDPLAGDIQLSGDGIFHPTELGQSKIEAAVKANYLHSL